MNKDQINIRSKGTRDDYEVMERFVELLHEGFDGGRDDTEEREFQALLKEIGYSAYSARELYHFNKKHDWLVHREQNIVELARVVREQIKRENDYDLYNVIQENGGPDFTLGEKLGFTVALLLLAAGLWWTVSTLWVWLSAVASSPSL